MIDRKSLRLSAVLLVVGFIFYVVVSLLHPDGPANNHSVVFAEHASSASWTAVHLGQFAGMTVIIAGLLVLCIALDVRAGGAACVARSGAVAAVVALGSTACCRRDRRFLVAASARRGVSAAVCSRASGRSE